MGKKLPYQLVIAGFLNHQPYVANPKRPENLPRLIPEKCGRLDPTYQCNLPSSKLTWQWNIPIFNRKYIFKWWIFHCHVSLPECSWCLNPPIRKKYARQSGSLAAGLGVKISNVWNHHLDHHPHTRICFWWLEKHIFTIWWFNGDLPC